MKKYAHSVPDDVDIEMAIALAHPVRATCGKRWVPTLYGAELVGIPDCPTCYPVGRVPKAPRSKSAARPHFVYRCYDAADALLYVGCTNSPRNRFAQHASSSWWWSDVHTVRNLVFPDRDAALARERAAIRSEMPRCNVKGRWLASDDRNAWTAQDYLDLRYAIVQAIETTHGVYGVATNRLLVEIDSELTARFGVTSISELRPA